jgi:hypothetical protein
VLPFSFISMWFKYPNKSSTILQMGTEHTIDTWVCTYFQRTKIEPHILLFGLFGPDLPSKNKIFKNDVMSKHRNVWNMFKTSEILWEENLTAASQFRLVRHASGTPLAPFGWQREWKLWPWVVVSVASPLPASSPPSYWQFPRASPV